MPKISHRAENMPASPVRKLVPYALQAKQKGIKVYHLNIGQPDIETPQTALDAVKNIAGAGWNIQTNGDKATQVKPSDTVDIGTALSILSVCPDEI